MIYAIIEESGDYDYYKKDILYASSSKDKVDKKLEELNNIKAKYDLAFEEFNSWKIDYDNKFPVPELPDKENWAKNNPETSPLIWAPDCNRWRHILDIEFAKHVNLYYDARQDRINEEYRKLEEKYKISIDDLLYKENKDYSIIQIESD